MTTATDRRRVELTAVADEASRCERCELHRDATQTVFGEGRVPARLMLVGEQPGDREDVEGRPFVGPAGRVLRRALSEAGLSRRSRYETNAVKHFRWEPRGRRRIHRQPGAEHVRACHVWLERELALVDPDVLVLMGATAVGAFSRSLRVRRDHGRPLEVDGVPCAVVITPHPSAVLRAEDRDAEMAGLVADLRVAGELLAS